MHVEMLAPDRTLWSGDAEMVVARTLDGELGILPGHIFLLGQLAEGGVVRIRPGGGEEVGREVGTEVGREVVAFVSNGFLSVTPDSVSILAETAELAGEIDISRAESDLSAAQRDGDAAGVRRAEGRLRAAGAAQR